MTFFDDVCGCRMHLVFICLCGWLDDFTFVFLDFLFFIIVKNFFLLALFDLTICKIDFFTFVYRIAIIYFLRCLF